MNQSEVMVLFLQGGNDAVQIAFEETQPRDGATYNDYLEDLKAGEQAVLDTGKPKAPVEDEKAIYIVVNSSSGEIIVGANGATYPNAFLDTDETNPAFFMTEDRVTHLAAMAAKDYVEEAGGDDTFLVFKAVKMLKVIRPEPAIAFSDISTPSN